MSAPLTVYQELFQVFQTAAGNRVRVSSIARFTVFVMGIVAAKSCILAQIARELEGLALTKAVADSIERRLRRILNDPHLTPEVFYQPLLRQLIDWQQIVNSSRRLVLVIDESTKEDEIHLFRVSLTYRGRAVPLAWVVWQQNTKMAPGAYWLYVDELLATVAALLPSGVDVIVVADRAYEVPAFVDRIAALGWHWIVRAKTKASTRFLDYRGHQQSLASVLNRHVPEPGRRWKAQGWVFKDAGWRKVSVVAIWGLSWNEPLAVLTDLRPTWEVLALFDRRFWVEPSFRDDKSRGWQWENCQVKGLEHHQRLLLLMAAATLVTLCLGLQEAKACLERLAARLTQGRAEIGKPRKAKLSLFSLGSARMKKWLYGTIKSVGRLFLTDLNAPSWQQTWYQWQSLMYIFKTVRP